MSFIFIHNTRFINDDISHNKFKFGNISVSNGKKIYTLKFSLKEFITGLTF